MRRASKSTGIVPIGPWQGSEGTGQMQRVKSAPHSQFAMPAPPPLQHASPALGPAATPTPTPNTGFPSPAVMPAASPARVSEVAIMHRPMGRLPAAGAQSSPQPQRRQLAQPVAPAQEQPQPQPQAGDGGSISSFVPKLLQQQCHLVAGGEPAAFEFQSVVLFADVSGFTPLTAKLSSLGPSGVEQLTSVLNNYLGSLVGLIHAHGGDVVQFAGDAVIAVWPATDGNELANTSNPFTAKRRAAKRLELQAKMATQCAYLAQRQLDRYEAIDGVFLRMRMAIGTGPMCMWMVGGRDGKWDYVVGGEPLDQIKHADALASPGDLVLSPATFLMVEEMVQGKTLAQDGSESGAGPERSNDALPNRSTWMRGNQDGDADSVASSPAVRKRVRSAGKARGQRRDFLLVEAIPELLPYDMAAPWPVAGPEEAATVKSFLSPCILHTMIGSKLSSKNELRNLTVIFIKVVGIKHVLGADILDQVQNLVAAVQDSLSFFEGVINKLLMDEKGFLIVAEFGLPPFSHEDDPVRAVRAVLDIKTKLRKQQIISYIGVNSGNIFAGAYGHANRHEYGILGNAVNMAARQMAQARDDIYVCQTTYDEACSSVDFETLPEIVVKGRDTPMPVYRPLATNRRGSVVHTQRRKSQSGPRSRRTSQLATTGDGVGSLIGRRTEMQLFRDTLTQFLQGSLVSPAILLSGEPGIGKTRLLNEMMTACAGSYARSVAIQGAALDVSTQWLAVRHLLVGLLATTVRKSGSISAIAAAAEEISPKTPNGGAPEMDLILQSAADKLGPTKSHLLPLLNQVLQTTLQDSPEVEKMTRHEQALALEQILLDIVAAATRGIPLCIFVDQAQWLDASSWHVLLEINERLPKVMTVFATRTIGDMGDASTMQPTGDGMASRSPSALGRSIAASNVMALAERSTTIEIPLEPLGDTDAEELLRKALGVSVVPPDVADVFRHKAQGNPLFIVELTTAMLDAGAITVAHGTMTHDLHRVVETKLPLSIAGLAVSNLDKLSPDQLFTLKCASVIGEPFDLEMLTTVHIEDVDAETVRQHVTEMVQLGLMRRTMDVMEQKEIYQIASSAVAETAYEMMMFSNRQEVHAAVAQQLQARGRNIQRGRAGDMLVYHLVKGGQVAKAVRLLDEMAQRACAEHDYGKASELWKRAEAEGGLGAVVESTATVARRCLRIARVSVKIGHLEMAMSKLQQGLSAVTGGTVSTRSSAVSRNSVSALSVLFFCCVAPSKGGRKPSAVSADFVDLVLDLLGALAHVSELSGASGTGLQSARDMASLCAKHGLDDHRLVLALVMQARWALMTGKNAAVDRHLAAAQRVKSLSDSEARNRLRLLEADVYMGRCEWGAAQNVLLDLVDLAGEVRSEARLLEAVMLILHGRLTDATSRLQQVYNEAPETDGVLGASRAVALMAYVSLMLGNVHEANGQHKVGMKLLRDSGASFETSSALVAMAVWSMLQVKTRAYAKAGRMASRIIDLCCGGGNGEGVWSISTLLAATIALEVLVLLATPKVQAETGTEAGQQQPPPQEPSMGLRRQASTGTATSGLGWDVEDEPHTLDELIGFAKLAVSKLRPIVESTALCFRPRVKALAGSLESVQGDNAAAEKAWRSAVQDAADNGMVCEEGLALFQACSNNAQLGAELLPDAKRALTKAGAILYLAKLGR